MPKLDAAAFSERRATPRPCMARPLGLSLFLTGCAACAASPARCIRRSSRLQPAPQVVPLGALALWRSSNGSASERQGGSSWLRALRLPQIGVGRWCRPRRPLEPMVEQQDSSSPCAHWRSRACASRAIAAAVRSGYALRSRCHHPGHCRVRYGMRHHDKATQSPLVRAVLTGYRLPLNGVARPVTFTVRANGEALAAATPSADREVVQLFALLHDTAV